MTTNELLNSGEIALAEDVTATNYPILQKAYNEARDHLLGLFPEFAHALTTDYRLVPIRTPEFGGYVACIDTKRKVIFIGAWMEGCPVMWEGKEIILRTHRTAKGKTTAEYEWHRLVGILRHELGHAIQHSTGIDDGHGSTHLCRSWWWVMSEWATRLYGPDSFLSVEDFERILKLIRSKKNGKYIYDEDFRNDFTSLCKSFEYNLSRQSLANIRAEYLDEANFPLKKEHGNKGLKRDRVEKTCTHCGTSFMGSTLQVRCSVACNVKAGRLAAKQAKKLAKEAAKKESL